MGSDPFVPYTDSDGVSEITHSSAQQFVSFLLAEPIVNPRSQGQAGGMVG